VDCCAKTPHRAAGGDRRQRPRFDRTVVLSGLLSVLGNRETWPVVCVNFGICGSFFAFAGLWATPFLTQVHGMSRTVAANHVSLYFAGFALGCALVGTCLGPARPAQAGAAGE
jgi:hypothetical protein